MAKVINCPCGWTVRSEDDEDLIRQVQAHAKDVHSQEAKRDEILAMARSE